MYNAGVLPGSCATPLPPGGGAGLAAFGLIRSTVYSGLWSASCAALRTKIVEIVHAVGVSSNAVQPALAAVLRATARGLAPGIIIVGENDQLLDAQDRRQCRQPSGADGGPGRA